MIKLNKAEFGRFVILFALIYLMVVYLFGIHNVEMVGGIGCVLVCYLIYYVLIKYVNIDDEKILKRKDFSSDQACQTYIVLLKNRMSLVFAFLLIIGLGISATFQGLDDNLVMSGIPMLPFANLGFSLLIDQPIQRYCYGEDIEK